MSTPNIFPLHSDIYGWAQRDSLARRLWQRLRLTLAPDLVWYGVAIKIKSERLLTLYVYDMDDSVAGGIGDQIFEADINRDMMTSDECAMMDALIIVGMNAHAESEYDKRQKRDRAIAIDLLRRELFGI